MKVRVPQAPKGTWVWHYWHEPLLAFAERTLSARRQLIRQDKPTYEQALRIARLRPVRDARVKKIMSGVRKKFDVEGRSWSVWLYSYSRAVSRAEKDYILKVHKRECPKCPWGKNRKSLVGDLFTHAKEGKDGAYLP